MSESHKIKGPYDRSTGRQEDCGVQQEQPSPMGCFYFVCCSGELASMGRFSFHCTWLVTARRTTTVCSYHEPSVCLNNNLAASTYHVHTSTYHAVCMRSASYVASRRWCSSTLACCVQCLMALSLCWMESRWVLVLPRLDEVWACDWAWLCARMLGALWSPAVTNRHMWTVNS